MNSGKSQPTSNTTVLWIIGAFLALIIGGVIIAQATPLLFPPQGSAESRQIDDLFKFMLAIGGAIFLLVQGALVYSVIRFRAKPGDTSDGANIHGNATLELVWTAIPAVIVLVLTVYSYQVWVSTREAKSNEQTVYGRGARFVWSFSYDVPASAVPSDVELDKLPQNIQDAITNNSSFPITSRELHTFVGQPIKMVLDTADTLHAFWIPAMRIKQDLIAGRTTEIRFTPIQAGEFPVVCAELCGGGHGDMRAKIIVHADETEYLTWFNDQVNAVVYPPDDPVLRGQQVLASGQYPCAGCHTLTSMSWTGITGPNLNGVGDRAATVRSAATGETPEEYIHRSLYHPTEYLVPGFGPLMPQFQPEAGLPNFMPVDDNKAIVAYLCTQTSTGESACDLSNLDAIIAAAG